MAGSRKSYVKVSRVRRLLRTYPEAVREPIRKVITDTADQILNEATLRAPIRTGRLRRSLSKSIARDGLTVKVGQLRKRASEKAFYGKFIEYGTRGYQNGSVRRAQGSRTTKIIRRSVPARNAEPFLQPAIELAQEPFRKNMAAALDETMRRVTTSGPQES